jgi:hypothetical protein
MGPVSWVATQILPRLHDQEATVNVELNAFEDAINRASPYAELRNAACDADFQKIPERVAVGDEYSTFTATGELPSEILTTCPCSSWHSADMMTHTLKVAHLC